MKFVIFSGFLFCMLCGCLFADGLNDLKTTYKKADATLNRTYSEAKKTMSPETFRDLQKDQRNWIKYRDWMAESQMKLASAEEHRHAYWKMMISLTTQRSQFIKIWMAAKPDYERWVGTYCDGYGGVLDITKKEDGYSFRLTVVRCPTGHIGEISGKLKVNHGRARFSDHGRPFGEPGQKGDQEAWLDFQKMPDGFRIEVTATNAGEYCGLRAYFGGVYLRQK
jgi:hypothetical protein